jgi:hypothetical protein
MNERFVTQEENDSIVKNVFIVIGYSFLSILMIILLAWGYYTSQYLFIAVYSFIILLYNSMIIAFVVINKQIYDSDSYGIIIGSTIISMVITFAIICLYVYKYFGSIKEAKQPVQDIKYSYNY